MKEKHPFEDVFRQIGDILNFIQENSAKGEESDEVSPEILKKLNDLGKAVQQFRENGEEIVRNTGVTSQELQNLINISSQTNMRKEDELILKKASELKIKVEEAQKKYTQKAMEGQAKGVKLPDAKKEEKHFGKKRQKKFKRFGINEKWKPL